MSDADDAIFGKIDALLGKRVGFAGAVARHREENDFPLLTEVVEPEHADAEPIALDYQRAFHPPSAPAEPAQALPEPPPAEPAAAIWGAALAPEPEIGPALEAESVPVPAGAVAIHPEEAAVAEEPKANVRAPHEAMATGLDDARLEAMLRRVVREELERLLGRG